MNDEPTREKKSAAREDFAEQPVWKQINGTWRPLHGSFFSTGLSLEWHDFRLEEDLDWSPSFHADSLEVCLNFSGQARLKLGSSEQALDAGQIALYCAPASTLQAWRLSDSLHRFITVELSPEYLRDQFKPVAEGLKPEVRRFAETGQPSKPFLEILAMPASLLNLRLHLLEPPVSAPARPVWYQGKVLDVLSQVLFRAEPPGELFCQKYKRANDDRVARAVYLLERDLENPPSLEMLAAEVECSAFHLSRLFSQKMGASIPKFIRTRRIERAAELLRSGKMNVTEAAMTVGYSSLSAFNKAFVEQIGCCPGLYPHMKTKVSKT